MNARSKWIIGCTSLCLLAGTTFAQYDYGAPMPSKSDSASQAKHSREFYVSKDLVGAKVKDAQGQKLGEIDEVLINPQNGQTFAAIGVERGRQALVPLQAMNIERGKGMLRNAEVTLNTTKETLQSGPTVAKNEWQSLDNPSFTQSIYSHYKLEAPSAIGGASSPGGVSGGSQSSTNNQVQPQEQPPLPQQQP